VVQGVGFRPFVYRLATSLGLTGWVLNSGDGLVMEVQSDRIRLDEFVARLESERPTASVILARESTWLAPDGCVSFEILHSESAAAPRTGILPDLATCPECLREIKAASERRYAYPFTNCTLCGPRFSIIEAMPYDRPRTTMKDFVLCPECENEFRNPHDRRFHAQPIACPRCGPQLDATLAEAAATIQRGGIVALKGVGGFQLMADARNATAVAELRRRKQRDAKPFALMLPNLASVRSYCHLFAEEERILTSSAAPIVLLEPIGETDLAPNVSDSSPFLGVMLPYSPLHHLLMQLLPFPLVATSGNLSGEPIAIDNAEARARLGQAADLFVTHNRPIARPCDDSVVRLCGGKEQLIRRARGYAPLPIRVPETLPRVLAVGPHMKSAVAIACGRDVIISQHLGDLDSLESRCAFERAIHDLCALYQFDPDIIACDLHPDYYSTQWARSTGKPVIAIQHHHAHAAACAAENDLREPYLAVVWDGTGYGLDQTIWGGEFFAVRDHHFERTAHLRSFRLPGGDAAVRQGWRAAAAIQYELNLESAAPVIVRRMLEKNLNCPITTSAGRLFDAVAALTGIAAESRFEGQAAMLLERAARASTDTAAYPMPLTARHADWAPLIHALLDDLAHGVARPIVARRFHNALARLILEVAQRTRLKNVVLSGGVFQNDLLSSAASALLRENHFAVFTHQRVPPNDGGISLGQAVLAATAAQSPPTAP
jgi:hydrogenase maturation protein HypF